MTGCRASLDAGQGTIPRHLGRIVGDADRDLEAADRELDRFRDHAVPLGIGEPVGLAEHAEDEDAVAAAVDQIVDQGGETGLVERFVGQKRRRHHAVNAGFEGGGHVFASAIQVDRMRT